jgi:serine/threonine-protein kinase
MALSDNTQQSHSSLPFGAASDLSGRIIGKYKILQRLGRGGMAEVYKANQTTLDRFVAFKVISPLFTDDPDFLKRFEREAKAVAALRHPNIVQVFDYDVEGNLPYMVMEFIEGETLKAVLDKLARHRQTMPFSQSVRIVREVGQALTYAHQRGVIHRDLKPANVMLDKSGRVILTDFGVAKIVSGQALTATGTSTGTPAYMSPEQALGQPADQRTDLYALGVLLYELVTGQVPFDADTPLAVMLKHAHAQRPSPRSLRPDLPEGLERVILKSMARDSHERFQSAEEMITALGNLAAAAQIPIPASVAAAAPHEPHDVQSTPPLSTSAEGPTVPPLPPVPSPDNATPQDVTRTASRKLKAIACYHCGGAGLDLEPDGQVLCQFCGAHNRMAGPVCPHCEFVNAPGADICLDCGRALFRSCPNCDTQNWSGAEKCVRCGQSLDALSAVIDRHQDAGERFHRQQQELAKSKEQEFRAAEQRQAYFEQIEQRRQQSIREAQARKAREQQLFLIGVAVIAVLALAAVIVFVVMSGG